MSPNILFVTVGGSHQPIATAIRSLSPDRVIFICSEGPKGSQSQVLGKDKPCEVRRGAEVVERSPNIPTQLGLGDRFNPNADVVLLKNPDDLSECYQSISAKIRLLREETPGVQLWADYTGGTKTMSLAMGLAALDYGVTLYLTTGATRPNLIRIEEGEATGRAPTARVTVERRLNQFVPKFLQQFNYSAAIAELQYLLNAVSLASEEQQRIRQIQTLCKGLDAWDRFDHIEAWRFLKPQMKSYQALGQFLKRVMASRGLIDDSFIPVEQSRGHGYEVVEDLLLNAERRSHQGRYDDAVGRLYRALELLGQVRLKLNYGLRTGDIDRGLLPEAVATRYETIEGKLQLGLMDSYRLLGELGPDPLGDLFEARANLLQDMLGIRNRSLFAHGFNPISVGDFAAVEQAIAGFIRQGIQECVEPQFRQYGPVQFPVGLDE